ncbi:MAG: S8 family serine peptidase, partial [Gemmatimonadetes bacterium]|nr:S8 family serine peptidase [Gemmatimonadota bacterium]
STGGPSGNNGPPTIPGQLVVDLSVAVDLPTFHSRWGTATLAEIEGSEAVLVRLPAGQDAMGTAFQMIIGGDCDTAEPNFELESPDANQGVVAFVETGHVFSDVADQDALGRIGAPAAQALGTGAGVVVAIIDTGIDATHPDLAGAVLPGWDFVQNDGDASETWNNVDDDLDGMVDEGKGHGTHVAGIVHAVAPGAMLLPVRVLDDEGMGSSFDVARGIRWAVDQGAQVINLSLGMSAKPEVVKEAIEYAEDAGVFVAASAGNFGQHVHSHYPAKFSDVVGVAATDATDMKAGFSSFGSLVSVSAPGDAILSTYPGGLHAVWSGTSFATPMISGGAAIRAEIRPGSSADELAEAIEDSAFPVDYTGLPYAEEMGSGRVDLAAMVQLP